MIKRFFTSITQLISSVTFFIILGCFLLLAVYLYYWAVYGYFRYGVIFDGSSLFQYSHAVLLIYIFVLLIIFARWIVEAGLNLSQKRSARGVALMLIGLLFFGLELWLFQLFV